MRHLFLLTAAILLITLPALAESPEPTAPKAVVIGPTGAAVGDLVVLDASESAATDFAWVQVPKTKNCLPVDGGKRLVFASGTQGTYTFILAVAVEGKVATAVHSVSIGAAPGPNPPVPPPPPPPDLPDGKFHLARLTRDWALQVVSLEPAARRQAAQSLAASFRSIASAIAAGTLVEPATILAETKTSNNRALGEHQEAWKAWAKKLADKLREASDAGSLRTADDYGTCWREIALGLEAVK